MSKVHSCSMSWFCGHWVYVDFTGVTEIFDEWTSNLTHHPFSSVSLQRAETLRLQYVLVFNLLQFLNFLSASLVSGEGGAWGGRQCVLRCFMGWQLVLMWSNAGDRLYCLRLWPHLPLASHKSRVIETPNEVESLEQWQIIPTQRRFIFSVSR